MIAFDVYLNRKKLCRAGFNEFGDICAHINWRRGPHVKLATGFQHGFQQTELLVAGTNVRYKSKKAPHFKRGFEYAEGLEWVKRKLKVGDELSIRIVESDSVDKPRERTVEYQTKIQNLISIKRYVRGVAKEYGWKVQF